MAGPRAAMRWVRLRALCAAWILAGLFGAVGYKAWSVQIGDGERLRALGKAQYLQVVKLQASRGSIRDCNGVELAGSIMVDSVFANPREIENIDETAITRAKVLDLDRASIAARLDSEKRFVWIKHRVSAEEAKRVRELELPGIALAPEPKRFYPGGTLAGIVLGFASMDGKGLEGLEYSLDKQLRGESLFVPALRDARGRMVLAEGMAERPPAGATVVLTIDRFVQYAAEQALLDAVGAHKARAGVVVVLAARTGEVLAMATHPSYDPNDPRKRGSVRNLAVTDAYEVGSVMKVFSVAAALDAGVVRPSDRIDIEGGRLQIGSKVVRDTHDGEDVISVSEVIKYSSNVGAAKISRRLGKERLAESLRRYGFGSRSGIELPGERSGFVRDPRDPKGWGEIGLATAAFGYGMLVTPLQLAVGMGAIANGGVLNPPRVVKQDAEQGGDRESPARHGWSGGKQVMKATTAKAMAAMLATVLEPGGTAESIRIPGFVAAGKTGTAHKLDPRTRRYAADRYLASFVGFVPVEDPRLVIVAIIDEPRGGKHYGGEVAGPVFARVAEETLKYYGVAGTGTEAILAGKAGGGGPDKRTGSKALEDSASAADTASPGNAAADLLNVSDSAGLAGAIGSISDSSNGSGGSGESSESSGSEKSQASGGSEASDWGDGSNGSSGSSATDTTGVTRCTKGCAGAKEPLAELEEGIVVIPDFAGMGMKRAIRAARAAGARIEIEGSGTAISQFPAAGRAAKSVVCRVVFGTNQD
ncbi:MAG: penicillin-binding protein 2 [Pseudomonadota bacterium]